MLASRNRFHGHGSLRFVYSRGKVTRTSYFVCKYSHNPHRKTPRVSVVISKKVVKSAVKRNRIRRRLYETIRLELPKLLPQTDLVYIVVSSDVLIASNQEITSSITRSLHAAQLYNTVKN